MKPYILIYWLFLTANVFAQATKGLSIAEKPVDQSAGKIYGLIIGISKYKDAGIPKLQYADKDARAFRDYLAAAGADTNNLTLLLNEQANYIDIILNLDDICTQKAKRGDKVFIYFSGHGDVESRVITKLGYLLPYDAPRQIYAINAIDIRKLQDYISTLSANGVQAYVIVDACHSGNLAGGLEGMKNMETVLSGKWQDEIKILSCQPGELSLEGKQWGDGRGLFSYELINGLAGEADKNKDGKVSLRELNLYLMDKVSEEASPNEQNPVVNGKMESVVSFVNPAFKTSSVAVKEKTLMAIDTKGTDEALLRGLPDSVKLSYKEFNIRLDSARYYQPYAGSAYYYYKSIPETPATHLLKSIMKRNLAAPVLKELTSQVETASSNKSYCPRNCYMIDNGTGYVVLKELLGVPKLREMGLMPKILYMEAITQDDVLSDPSDLTFQLLDSALQENANAAYASAFLAHAWQLRKDFKRSKDYALQALAVSPTFMYALKDLAVDYLYLKDYDSSLYYTGVLQKLDTAKYNGHMGHMDDPQNNESLLLALNDFAVGKMDSFYANILRFYPDTFNAYYPYFHVAEMYFKSGDYPQAIRYSKLVIEKELTLEKSGLMDETADSFNLRAGDEVYSSSGTLSLKSNIYYQISITYSKMNETDSALFYLDKSLLMAFKQFRSRAPNKEEHYYALILNTIFRQYNHIHLDKDITELMNLPQFGTVLRRYCPEYKK